jgi:hypothetical protein
MEVTLQFLADLASNGIKNHNGADFTNCTLKNLLTDMRYIGEWITNEANKGKDTSLLYPYEEYVHVKDLPHGCVIDRKLWYDVQAEVNRIKNQKRKNLKVKRVNLLQGILKSVDGSNYTGDSSKKNNAKKEFFYYRSKLTGKRITAELIEVEAKKVLLDIVTVTPRLQEAISLQSKTLKSNLSLLNGLKVSKVNKLKEIQSKRDKLNVAITDIISSST